MSKRTRLFLSIGIPLLFWLIPREMFPIENLSVLQHRTLAILVMAAAFWILEPIPVYATSLLVVVLELVALSDSSLILFHAAEGAENFGEPLSYKTIMATFASPIILLFLGGFFLAMAATKYRLDVNLARVLLKPFGQNPRWVLMGLMCITAVFSMFMSNTATTAMMLAILVPVLAAFPENDSGKTAFVLGIPFAANIGGIGTPIGTPPNAIALQYFPSGQAIGFGTWMSFAVPFVVILLAIAWALLLWLYPPQASSVEVQIKGKFLKHWRALTVYGTFAVTVLLWLTDDFHKMNVYTVSMIPVAVFSVTQIITKEDLRKISWDVLWLVAGGIALGVALDKTGAAEQIVVSIPFASFSPLLVLALAGLVTITMSNLMSNTATANLLMPMMIAIAVSVPSLGAFGGASVLLLCVSFAASLAMVLPISTPPNALAHATGLVNTEQMRKAGLLVGGLGLLMTFGMLLLLNSIQFFSAP